MTLSSMLSGLWLGFGCSGPRRPRPGGLDGPRRLAEKDSFSSAKGLTGVGGG